MKKIKLRTNQGALFDWLLNLYLNFKLWWYGIYDDEERALEIINPVMQKLSKIIK